MSSDIVIRAEGLGKKYLIQHGAGLAGLSFREVMTQKIRGIAKSSKAIITRSQRDSSEETEEFWALKNLNFEIGRGEVVGIIGRNGAGKSTLLKILSRITDPTEGSVRIRGRVASLLEVGTGFHPDLTGRENMYLNGAILGMNRAEIRRKFDEIVAFAGIERFLDTPVKRYSSGMYVRLAFAVAAHLEPEIMIVDEVLAVGDAEFQHKCLGKMHDVAGLGRTVLFVSHNMVAVEQLCSRAFCLESGRVKMAGPVKDVIADYLSNTKLEILECIPDTDPSRVAEVRRIAICAPDGKALTHVTTADSPCLKIELLVRERQPDLNIAFSVHDTYQNAIFASCPADCGISQPTQQGLHEYFVAMPGPLFLPQRYSITVSVYSTRSVSFHDCPHALTFEVAPAPSQVYSAAPNRVGVMQILCNWSHRLESTQESRAEQRALAV